MRRGISLEAEVIAALPATIAQIVAKTGASRATAFLWARRLRSESKIHIASWKRTTGQSSPVYAAGEGKDATKPKRRTQSAYCKRHYKKHRRDLDKELRASAAAARANAASTRKNPHSWLSALGVAA